jgi:hypothetical protein
VQPHRYNSLTNFAWIHELNESPTITRETLIFCQGSPVYVQSIFAVQLYGVQRTVYSKLYTHCTFFIPATTKSKNLILGLKICVKVLSELRNMWWIVWVELWRVEIVFTARNMWFQSTISDCYSKKCTLYALYVTEGLQLYMYTVHVQCTVFHCTYMYSVEPYNTSWIIELQTWQYVNVYRCPRQTKTFLHFTLLHLQMWDHRWWQDEFEHRICKSPTPLPPCKKPIFNFLANHSNIISWCCTIKAIRCEYESLCYFANTVSVVVDVIDRWDRHQSVGL